MQNKIERQLRLSSAALPYVSAQLRASMSGIYAALQSLAPAERRCEDAQVDHAAALLELSYYQLLRLAGNLSAADRFSGDTPLQLEQRDLAAFCCDLCDKARALFDTRSVQLQFSAAPRRLVTAFDPVALERLLLNLMSNALKATPNGGSVSVSLRLNEEHRVILCVTDNGCGLEGTQPEQLFALQLDEKRILSGNPGGLGLGLPLCRIITEAHGGSIVLTNAPNGCGAQAVVSLPACTQESLHMRDSLNYDYLGGFDHVKVELSNALSERAFLLAPREEEQA